MRREQDHRRCHCRANRTEMKRITGVGERNDMSTIPYTREQWNHLIRQGDPEAGLTLGGDLASWEPKIERICARHGLSVDGEMQWKKRRPGVRCASTVFLVGDVAVKLFTRPSPIWFPREVEALRALGEVPQAKTPRLLAYGDAISDDDPQHPYLIMERLHGEEYWAHRDHRSLEEECALVAQVAEMARALHDTPTERLQSFGRSPEEWVRRIQARAALWEEGLAPQLPPYLAAQVPEFLAENLPLVTEEFRPCLLSADLHVGHILVEKRDGAWRVTGHIDLGDVEVGPVEYEWVPVCQKAFRGDETLMRAFFAAYGWPLPVPREVKQRLKLYTLLHRFPPLDFPDRQITEGASLEAVLDAQWPI
jgi:aminoglycoside phosphotransferase (APT) family kinase protein